MVSDFVYRINRASNRLLARHTHKPRYEDFYRQLLDTALANASVAIHLGAGGRDPASITSAELEKINVWGVDPSEESLARNPNPKKIVAWGDAIPLPGESVDVIFSEHLMEHVADPDATIREAFRLLHPGGSLIWVAPNLLSYSGLATWLTPHWFHNLVIRLERTKRKPSEDVFPTFFRINTEWSIKRILKAAGFTVERISTFSNPPGYTISVPVVHQLMCLWHFVLNRVPMLHLFDMNHVVVARKPIPGS